MITLSNGHRFSFCAASGALGFNGEGWPWEQPLRWAGLLDPKLFTIVTKTLTFWPHEGYFRWRTPWDTVRVLRHGTVNAMGMPNKGFHWWFTACLPRIRRSGRDLIVSLDASGTNAAEFLGLIHVLHLQEAQHQIRGIELNLSCPNTGHPFLGIAEVLKRCEYAAKISHHPLIAKLSVAQDYREIGARLSGMVEAVAINSVPWKLAFPDRKSPLERYGGGGVSGKAAQPFTWRMAEELAVVGAPPVIWPSIWNYEDLGRAFAKGAQAVSFGSVFLPYPWRPTRFVRRWQREHPQEL